MVSYSRAVSLIKALRPKSADIDSPENRQADLRAAGNCEHAVCARAMWSGATGIHHALCWTFPVEFANTATMTIWTGPKMA